MPASDARRPVRLRVRLVLLAVLLLPLLGGAIAASFVPDSTAPDGGHRVAIVRQSTAAPAAASGTLTTALTATPGFDWQVVTATEAARRLSDRSVFAVVTIPDTFTTNSARPAGSSGRPAAGAPAGGQVQVVPSGNPTDPDYARLERAVSGTAVRVGIEGLLVSVSQSRTNLNVAALTAAGLKAAAANADGTVNDVLNSVKQLLGQTDPLIDQAQSLITALRQYTAIIDELSGKLTTFADSMRGVTLTLGDLQHGVGTMHAGLASVDTMLRDTAAVRAELNNALWPIADVLRASGLPDGQRVGDQLTGLLTMVSGLDDPQTSARIDSLQVGTQLLDSQLRDLSGLLGRPVDAQTQLVDVLDLAVGRLTDIRAFLAQGDSTINQVMAQLNDAKQLMPTMEGQIRGQLEQLKAATTQLVVSLNSGVNGLPDTSAATANRLSQNNIAASAVDSRQPSADLLRATVTLLLGALVIALLQAVTADRLTSRGWLPRRAGTASWALAVVLSLGLAVIPSHYVEHRHTLMLYGCAVVAVFAAVTMSAAVLRLFGRLGLAGLLTTIAAATTLDIGSHRDTAPGLRLLPGSYVLTGLDSAGAAGTSSTLLLPVIVLLACGGCAIAVYLWAARAGSRAGEPA
ncbi:hypothetical protein ABZ942_00360 [Nocardia sp. NPDC046473]|uniref:hypothetical protein n=1 Tax=Nocardia sp. NPDC046473 TaxID=3155733 RepID=UPI0033E64995